MGAITDFWKSERGLYALALLIASTVLTGLGHMTIDAWREFNLYIFGIYVVGKTATGVTGLIKGFGDTSTAAPTKPDAAPAEPAKPGEPVTPAATTEPPKP